MILAAGLLANHWPHIALLVAAQLLFLWFFLRLPPSKAPPEEQARWHAERARRRLERRRVRASAARRGLLVLGPTIAAVATGAVVYGIELGRGRPGAAALWSHFGISLLAVLLSVYKLLDVGLGRLREGLRPDRLFEAGASLLFSVLLVPLTITGVALAISPSDASFAAYSHLVISVWWTVLLLWHLRRHLVPSIATLRSQAHGGAPD